MQIRTPSLILLRILLVLTILLSTFAPASTHQELLKGEDLFLKGNVGEAISFFLGFPKSTEASYWLVRAYLNQAQPEKAITEAQKIHAADPDSALALTAMGDVDFRRGQFDSAAKFYRQAIDTGEEFARAYLGLGKILESERSLKSAQECFLKAFAIDPDDPDIIRERVRYHKPSPEEKALWKRYLESAGYEDPAYIANLYSWLERREAWAGISLRRLREVPEETSIDLLHFYTAGQYNRYGVKVKINGRKTARLLLDSGASGIVIKDKFAKSARVPLYGEEKTRGLGSEGDREAGIGLADTLEIGDLVFENYPVSFAGKEIPLAEDGIIGTEVFSRFLITLDFNKKKMRLEKQPDPEGVGEEDSYSVYDFDWEPGPGQEDYSPFRFIHGKVLVPSLINGKEEAHLILDTGSSYNVFSHRLADRVDYTKATNTSLDGISGRIQDIRRVSKTTIALAGIELGSHQTMAIDLDHVSHVIGTEIGGMVGYPFLKRGTLFLDYRTGCMKMIPDPYRAED